MSDVVLTVAKYNYDRGTVDRIPANLKVVQEILDHFMKPAGGGRLPPWYESPEISYPRWAKWMREIQAPNVADDGVPAWEERAWRLRQGEHKLTWAQVAEAVGKPVHLCRTAVQRAEKRHSTPKAA